MLVFRRLWTRFFVGIFFQSVSLIRSEKIVKQTFSVIRPIQLQIEMVHVNSFLGCAKIETGGKIVAFLQIITYAIVLILFLAAICLAPVSEQTERMILKDDQIVAEIESKPSATVLVLIAIFITAACIAIVVIACRSFNAINTRNHTRMFEMMALMFAITCFYLYVFFIQLWLWPSLCLGALIAAAYNFYLFIVVYSLYRVFRKEHEQEAIRQLQSKTETNV
ncbi:uncharacterized protein LOC119076144 isoform X2 [Bradysia coprophila]|uniref:uncharacterized protein LOC119076144 isoform X2 n=1 Tax=Bradysia coprophila TaxID=38358 RepID=UPI00187D7054|nr:uncharacterized protein LOC119076144 isoform X2 [Bradysia coprophila]